MSWYHDDNDDYALETGWFQDPFRVDTKFLFVPDGLTNSAVGHGGFTSASNLPQLFNSDGWTYDSLWRTDETGDNVNLTLNENTTVFTGLPNHPYTGVAALTQTLDREFEGAYWEGSYYDDQFTLDIQSSFTNLRSFYYWGESGDDILTIKGDFSVLDLNHDGSNESPSDVGNAFRGGSGYDRLIIEANFDDEFTIDYLERDRGNSIEGSDDIQTVFNIVGPGESYFEAEDVEEVIFNDRTFTPSDLPPTPSPVTLSTKIYSVSAAEAGDLSQALTFNDGSQTISNYIEKNGPISTDVTSNNSEADIFAVKQENAADGDNFYVLDVDANAYGNYNLNSYDISLGYDNNLFEVLDVGVNGEFNFFNSAAIDSDNGTVRVVGGSAENLGEGLGGGTADGNTFQLLLKAKHNDAHNNTDSINAAFTAKVNSTDTVLVDGEDIINGSSELLTSNYSFANSFVDFEATNNIAFATERSIGITGEDQKYTSLLREGSDLDSLGTFNLSTLGNITAAYQASIEQSATNIYTVDFIEGESVDLDQVKGDASHVEGSTNTYKLRLSVEGIAGDIIDLSQTSVRVSDQEDTDKYVETSVLAGKNLITYQSDINYDGRVSMMDLAYLNAGGGKTNGASIADVDVNYDKTIDLNDLEKMDDQWGNSLHTENLIENDVFTGNNGTINLKGISIADQGTADNSSFIAQNDFENSSSDFVDTLADAGSAGYSDPEFSGDYGDIYDAANNGSDPA